MKWAHYIAFCLLRRGCSTLREMEISVHEYELMMSSLLKIFESNQTLISYNLIVLVNRAHKSLLKTLSVVVNFLLI